MELLVPSSAAIRAHLVPFGLHIAAGKTLALLAVSSRRFPRIPRKTLSVVHASSLSSSVLSSSAAEAAASPCRGWIVVVEKPHSVGSSRKEVIDYYVETLARVLGNEKEAQMCIYDASWHTHFGFCCDIDEKASHELARLPGVLSVRSDTGLNPVKDYSSEYWLVRMQKPGVEVVTKAQMVDYYAQTLTKVLGNEKDAQACIYHISWEKDFGFCCQIHEECAMDLADVPGVLSVRLDLNLGSENKNYVGEGEVDCAGKDQIPNIKTKRLFVTGLSFYTSEKTLRAAFEGYGELVEVKIIMDKISKRSKGYAFIEYTTEEAASAALKEMNGKIINGWMIVVDVAKTNPPTYSRERQRPTSSPASSY